MKKKQRHTYVRKIHTYMQKIFKIVLKYIHIAFTKKNPTHSLFQKYARTLLSNKKKSTRDGEKSSSTIAIPTETYISIQDFARICYFSLLYILISLA